MNIIALMVVIAIIGLIAWGIPQIIPMPPHFVRIIYLVALFGVILIILSLFNISIPNINIGN